MLNYRWFTHDSTYKGDGNRENFTYRPTLDDQTSLSVAKVPAGFEASYVFVRVSDSEEVLAPVQSSIAKLTGEGDATINIIEFLNPVSEIKGTDGDNFAVPMRVVWIKDGVIQIMDGSVFYKFFRVGGTVPGLIGENQTGVYTFAPLSFNKDNGASLKCEAYFYDTESNPEQKHEIVSDLIPITVEPYVFNDEPSTALENEWVFTVRADDEMAFKIIGNDYDITLPDGTTQTVDSPQRILTRYNKAGVYKVITRPIPNPDGRATYLTFEHSSMLVSVDTRAETWNSVMTQGKQCFMNCRNLETLPRGEIRFKGDCSEMFSGCGGRDVAFVPDLTRWNFTESCNTCANMFEGNHYMIDPRMVGWKLPRNAHNMFKGCHDFIGTDLITWDTSKVENMDGMFEECRELGISISRWDTSKVLKMKRIFALSNVPFPLQLNGWDVSACTNFSGAFDGSDFNEDLSGWDVSGYLNGEHETYAEAFDQMFADSPFNQDISGWCVSEVGTKPTNFAPELIENYEPKWGLPCPPQPPVRRVVFTTQPQDALYNSDGDPISFTVNSEIQ